MIPGSLDRLNPRNDNDPLVLFQHCFDEYTKLLDYRIVQLGTIKSSVLNLNQRFITSALPAKMFEADLKGFETTGRDRFRNKKHRVEASQYYLRYYQKAQSFEAFLTLVGQHLPQAYAQYESLGWLPQICTRVAMLAEDLSFLRYLLYGQRSSIAFASRPPRSRIR